MYARTHGWTTNDLQRSESDSLRTVTSHMSPSHALYSVAPNTAVTQADEFARAHGSHHLLVVDGGALVGVVCRCDLGDGGGLTVGERIKYRPLVISPSASIEEAARIMASRNIGCLPVVSGDNMVHGVVTRTDLRKAGIAERKMGTKMCAACGQVHSLQPHPVLPGLHFCVECLDSL